MKPEWVQVDKGEFTWNTPEGFRYLVWEDLARHDWYAEHFTSRGWTRVDSKKLLYLSEKDAKSACFKHWKERKK